MIPISLRISGFLSYRDPVELNFTNFDLACISGANGAGKSSLLDAITWALFGQARKNGDVVVNSQSRAAEVALVFEYEEAIYRVQRSLPRGKSTLLEFQLLEEKAELGDQREVTWRVLTEHTVRETQARIEHILRLDYDTFINASFFLQGKADQFTQQTASKRKEVLGFILGLEMWETYKEHATARRKEFEHELDETEGRIAEINAELSEEKSRKARLAELTSSLEHLAGTRKMAETTLETLRRAAESLSKQRELAEQLAAVLSRSEQNLSDLETRLSARQIEHAQFLDLLEHGKEIEAAYEDWQQARETLSRWEEVAARFREHEARRQPFVEQIAVEKARLDQEREVLGEQSAAIDNQLTTSSTLQVQIQTAKAMLAETEGKLAERDVVEKQAAEARERQAELRAENQGLKTQMDELKTRIDRLKSAEGAACPLCGQPLSESHRLATLAQLESEGKEKGNRYRSNQAEIVSLTEVVTGYMTRGTEYASAEQDHRSASAAIAQLTERMENLQKLTAEWQSQGAQRLVEVIQKLQSESYAQEARTHLAEIDLELKSLGYDAATHDRVRQTEIEARTAEVAYRTLEAARAASLPLEREIVELQSQLQSLRSEVENQRTESGQAAQAVAQAEAQAPDVEAAERQVFDLQEQENRLNQEVGAARQAVTVLDVIRQRKTRLEAQSEALRRQIVQHKTLERAFGKDGVPALLIEQALPQIEARANDLLDRLSNGSMSLRFTTQAELKTRDALRETLDIQISDGAGLRDYEMFSGGEAFRVNFAVRLALSEVLAQRKGARLQTLVIDEGFGSQDTQGRQRLIEAINLVRSDFAKVLVITHLDELKDAFPARIEVEKTERGSSITVV